ncbi:MAG: hypothetical protein KAV00_16005 [Phycisphaerae bacterium]|nr:hypothetical protein [Phycisphaerae bacterium]
MEWKQMENDLSRWLSNFARNEVHFRNSHQAIIGLPSDSFRSDGMLTDNKVLIAIEVECGQTHPDTNTGKYWLLYKHKSYERIILFHIYTPDFDSYGWRKKLAEFYIEQMKSTVPIEYILLDFRKADDYRRTLTEIKKKIEEKVTGYFKL